MSTISNFTNASTFQQLNTLAMSEVSTLIINGKNVILSNGVVNSTISAVQTASNTINSGMTSLANATNTLMSGPTAVLKTYTTATTLALSTFDKLGEEIDKSIKGSFLSQASKIKGTEVLCSAFCLLVSMLPCNIRNNLYKAIRKAQDVTQQVKQAAIAVDESVKTFNAVLVSTDSIGSTAATLFGKAANGVSVTAAFSTIAALPTNISSIVNVITNAFKFQAAVNVLSKDAIVKGIYDLAQSVLFKLQAMAVQIADEALSKIINPLIDIIKDAIPSNCFGNMATQLFNTLVEIINLAKSKILGEIADLFVSSSDFTEKFDKFNKSSSTSIELKAFTKALFTIAAYFGDIAISCGVTPCNESSNKTKSGSSSRITSSSLDDLPSISTDNIEDISTKLAPILELPADNVAVTPTDIVSVYDLADEAPSQIVDLINDGVLNEILGEDAGDNYTIYKSDNSDKIKIVYKVNRICGA